MSINKDSQKAPNLRFKGFTDDWEQRELSDIVERVKSYSLSRSVETPNYTGTKYVHYGDIHTKVADKITNETNLPNIVPGDYETLRKGDIILADASEDYQGIATPSIIIDEPISNIVAGLHTIALRPTEIYPLFLYNLFKSTTFRKYGYKTGTGMKVFGISVINLMNFKGYIPSYKEQEKIASILFRIDNAIVLHQRKLDQLNQLKEALLQQMFPGKGETVPKLRFAGFEGEWEDRKLKDVSDMYDNLRVPVTASDRIAGETPYYGANGIQDYVKDYTHIGEFVLIAEDGANDLVNYPVHYVTGEVWVNNHAHVISAIEGKLDNLFLVSRLKSMNFIPWLVGGGRAKLNGDVLKKLPIIIPHLEEQQKIGSFFKHLDNTISDHQRKLEQLQNMKQVLLQNMFI